MIHLDFMIHHDFSWGTMIYLDFMIYLDHQKGMQPRGAACKKGMGHHAPSPLREYIPNFNYSQPGFCVRLGFKRICSRGIA